MRVRHLLAAVLILAAAGVRFIGLGWPELSPDEAVPAVNAIAGTPVASPYPVDLDPESLPISPAYASLSRPLMAAFGAETWAARAIPALAGLLLVLAPLVFVTRIGWPLALTAAALMAISPSLVTLSRTAGGQSLALLGVTGGILGLSAATRDGPSGPWLAAGAFSGLALASGLPVWAGLAGLGLAALAARSLGVDLRQVFPSSAARSRWSSFSGAGVVAFGALTTAFFSDVSLLSGALAAPGRWLTGWSPFSLDPTLRTSPLLILVEALVLGLALALLIGRRKGLSDAERGLAVWAGAALLLFLIYPGRDPSGLAWATVPAVGLAAVCSLRAIELAAEPADREVVWILALGAAAVAFFGFFIFQRFGPTWQGIDPVQRLGLLGSLLAITVGGVLVVWWGWGNRTLGRGLALAGLALLFLWDIGLGSSFNFSRSASQARGLWHRVVTPESAELLIATIEDVSQASIGRREGLTVDVRGAHSAQVGWLLRKFQPPDPAVGAIRPPPVILAQEGQPLPPASEEYIGQDLVMLERRGFSAGFGESLRALTGRPAPSIPSLWTIYVRSDLAGLPQGGDGEAPAP